MNKVTKMAFVITMLILMSMIAPSCILWSINTFAEHLKVDLYIEHSLSTYAATWVLLIAYQSNGMRIKGVS